MGLSLNQNACEEIESCDLTGKILSFVKTQLNEFPDFNAREVIFIIRLFLATVEGRDVPCTSHVESLGINYNLTGFVARVKKNLLGKGIDLFKAKSVDKGRRANYLLKLPDSDDGDFVVDFQSDSRVDELRVILSYLLVAINEPEDRFSLPENIVLDVESVRDDINGALAVVLGSVKVAKENKKIADFIVQQTLAHKAVSASAIMVMLNEGADVPLTYNQVRTRLHLFFTRINKSGSFELGINCLQHPSSGRVDGYYVFLRNPSEVPEVPLSELFFEVSPDAASKLSTLVDIALSMIPSNSVAYIVMLNSLKTALREGKSSNFDYCLCSQKETFPDSNLDARNYSEGIYRLADFLETNGLFKLVVSGKRFQICLLDDVSMADQFIDEWKSTVEISEEDGRKLQTRVWKSAKYLCSNVAGGKDYSVELKAMVQRSLEHRPFLSSEFGVDHNVVKDLIDRIRNVNQGHPLILGFDVHEFGNQRYILKLKEPYENVGGFFRAGVPAYPVKVDYKGQPFVLFDKARFDSLFRDFPIVDEESLSMQVLKILGTYSVLGKAIPFLFIAHKMKGCACVPSLFAYLRKVLTSMEDDLRLEIVTYNDRNFYLRFIDEVDPCLDEGGDCDEDDEDSSDFRSASSPVSVSVGIREDGSVYSVEDESAYLSLLEGLKFSSDDMYYIPGIREVYNKTSRGFEMVFDSPLLKKYGGIGTSKFKIISDDLSDSVSYSKLSESLLLKSGEVMIAVDGRLDRIAKVKLSIIKPFPKEKDSSTKTLFSNRDFLRWLEGK